MTPSAASPAIPLLTFDHVTFAHPQDPTRTLFHDASFSLAPATATALAGPNGVGKTTLLRLASGVLRPSSGRVLLANIPLASLSARDIARQVAVVPQHLEIPFDFTVEEVVEQGRTPHLGWLGAQREPDRRAIDRALALTDLTALRHRAFNELSGGERQRVKIALALAQQPRLLLLDEPTQNLDIGRQAELLALLEHLRSSGLTLLASIHELHLVPGHFSAVILLREGLPPAHGAPETLLAPRTLAHAFGIDPTSPALDTLRRQTPQPPPGDTPA